VIEQRIHPRVEIQIEVNYKNLDLFYKNTVMNISQGGMFIKTDSPLPLGSEIDLEFTLPGQEKTITARGLVVWQHQLTQSTISSQEPGMGIRLKEISQQNLALIRDFVEQVLAKKTAKP
jgi:uncharacterized protein (TIGR02266 family)